MKKLILAAAIVAALTSSTFATVTLTLSNTTAVLTNATISGNTTQRLVWGVIVDGDGDGFDGAGGTGTYLGNSSLFTGPSTTNGTVNTQQLFVRSLNGLTAIATDDYLALATGVFSTTGTGDGSTGFARPLGAIVDVAVGNLTSGDAFAIVWFNIDSIALGATTLGSSANGNVPRLEGGLAYGLLSGLSSPAMTLPSDGSTVTYANNFVGSDPLRTADFTLKVLSVPEPSSALLLLGAGAAFCARRRRNS